MGNRNLGDGGITLSSIHLEKARDISLKYMELDPSNCMQRSHLSYVDGATFFLQQQPLVRQIFLWLFLWEGSPIVPNNLGSRHYRRIGRVGHNKLEVIGCQYECLWGCQCECKRELIRTMLVWRRLDGYSTVPSGWMTWGFRKVHLMGSVLALSLILTDLPPISTWLLEEAGTRS